MQNTYNVYRMPLKNKSLLARKISEVNLIEQQTKTVDGHNLTLYFSDGITGNDIWWYKTYIDFFNQGVSEPKNVFYYGLFVIEKIDSPEAIYLISLGKSHFYLHRIIERDFGINVAVKIAKEDTLLLKKSRFFSGTKKQEISSYISFEKDSYIAGESVEHLKIRALDESIWGEKNIVFADSIQMDLDLDPTGLVKVIGDIESALQGSSVLELPKMELEMDEETKDTLNNSLVDLIRAMQTTVQLSDITIYGIEFCFSFLNYNYELYYWDKSNNTKLNQTSVNKELNLKTIHDFISQLPSGFDIDNVKVRFQIGEKGKFTQSLKEILDVHVLFKGISYALRNGEWYSFNQVFMEYLARSLSQIVFTHGDDLIYQDYLTWKADKETQIENETSEDNITYPEYYFNKLRSDNDGYELMDRELVQLQSLKKGGPKYRIEIADLYKEETVYAVKISTSDDKKLIYNIEQSVAAMTLILNRTIVTDRVIKKSCLWFITKKPIQQITDINSIQFLLSIEAWKQTMRKNGIECAIRHSVLR